MRNKRKFFIWVFLLFLNVPFINANDTSYVNKIICIIEEGKTDKAIKIESKRRTNFYTKLKKQNPNQINEDSLEKDVYGNLLDSTIYNNALKLYQLNNLVQLQKYQQFAIKMPHVLGPGSCCCDYGYCNALSLFNRLPIESIFLLATIDSTSLIGLEKFLLLDEKNSNVPIRVLKEPNKITDTVTYFLVGVYQQMERLKKIQIDHPEWTSNNSIQGRTFNKIQIILTTPHFKLKAAPQR